jgi:hypothetical protein
MTSSKELYDLISVYLKSKNLDAFAASFAEMFYDIEETADPSAISVAYSVEALLAASTAGACSEASLYAALKSLSPSLSIVECAAKIDPQQQQQQVPYYQFFKTFAGWAAGMGKVTVVADILPAVGFGSATVLPDTHRTNTDLPPLQQVIQVG